ncbi:MAG: gamma carbonic anhydrase family protein [Chloroflexia bacterium]|jgi:carbonic anhydrase/acetyltransferase-like protein (isoleucine patch superfamily)|nr:gamma carbonic anhydrase family protein [Chloroflexia bacterium]
MSGHAVRASFAERFPGAIILPYEGAWPSIADSAFIAPGAVVIGNVTIGENASIWFNTTVRGDIAPIAIGNRSNVQDGTLVHVNVDAPVVIGEEVTIGHTAIIHGTVIEDRVLVGMGAIVMSYSTIGADAVIAAGALIPERAQVPPGAVMVGVPAKERSRLDENQRAHLEGIHGRYVTVGRTYKSEVGALFADEEGPARRGD